MLHAKAGNLSRRVSIQACLSSKQRTKPVRNFGEHVMLDEKTKELIAIAASFTANCHPCLDYHVDKARQLGAAVEDIREAIAVGKHVRAGAAGRTDKHAAHLSGAAGASAMTLPSCG